MSRYVKVLFLFKYYILKEALKYCVHIVRVMMETLWCYVKTL